MSQELGTIEIQKIIPHRYPMLLIDKVTSLEIGKNARALHNVSINEEVVQANHGRFPLPLVIEAMAQTGAVALLSKDEFKGKIAYFGGIQKAEFLGQAYPGDQLILETELTKIKGNIGVGQAYASVDDKIIAKAELTFMID
ncbi:3-hydroxyacyl-[acyl-carrier-protein] dehydratase [Lactobacillus colini]|uniref:3-hydroxyacyl-[acyl-carrier-protein] dehydratase n=1 Tax=Lactobacillus colini TaxID=1819254 RepID=A0ABS4MD69_9LACO|nr:3-hydroxyacyl-ACP dehydratase FabZ [Lactobacillus colini]MBP2057630.1 3-hydroxyacyl-[acyl-carrier-protein] dehydratase [Lactobacillus colini]